jgi:hypothetical protein
MKLNSNVKLSGTFALLALLSFATGCGDDEKETTTDTGADTGSDTGSGSDTGTTDTGTTDTGTTDTGETDTTVTENTKIRVFHASDLANTASAAGVDIYTGDTLVVDSLDYRFGTGFLEVPAGDYAFNVFGDGAGPAGAAALAIPSLSYAANEAYTLVAYDDDGAIAPLRLDESTATIGAGNIRVRAIHAAGILPEVDIWNVTDAANPALLFENLAFGAATAQVEIPAAAYVLGIDLDNDATPDVTFDVPALPAGTSANIFAIADADGPHLVADLGAGEAVELLGQETAGETNIRVFHGAPSAGTVDIYTGGSAVVPGLEALSATNYLTVPEGDYAFDVFAAGADPTGTPAFSIPPTPPTRLSPTSRAPASLRSASTSPASRRPPATSASAPSTSPTAWARSTSGTSPTRRRPRRSSSTSTSAPRPTSLRSRRRPTSSASTSTTTPPPT